MSCTFAPRLIHGLTSVSVPLVMLVPILLGAIAPQSTIAATVPRGKALASIDTPLIDTPLTDTPLTDTPLTVDHTANAYTANAKVQDQPGPNAHALPGEQPSTPPPTHLSGASLLFLIWLVAEQVSADWSEAIGADPSDPSAGQPLDARPPQPLPAHTPLNPDPLPQQL